MSWSTCPAPAEPRLLGTFLLGCRARPRYIEGVADGFRSTEEEIVAAIDLLEDGEYEAALPILSRLVAFVPESNTLYEAWIEAHIGLERYAPAIALADAGIAAGRPRAPLELSKAFAHYRQGDFERAEAAARAAVAAEPDHLDSIELLTDLLVLRGRTVEALELCRAAAAEHPDGAELARQAIHIAKDMRRYQDVVDSALVYLRRFGRDADVLSCLGNAYVDLNDYRKADRAFRDAASLEPYEADHHINVVMTAIAAGNAKAADAYLGKLSRRDPELAAEVEEAIDEIFADADDDELTEPR